MDAVSRRKALATGSAAVVGGGIFAQAAHAKREALGEQPFWALPGAVPLPPGDRVRLAVLNHSHDDVGIIIDNSLEILSDSGQQLAGARLRLGAGRGGHVEYTNPRDPSGGGTTVNVHGLVRMPPDARIGATLMLLDGDTGNSYVTIQPCVIPDPEFA